MIVASLPESVVLSPSGPGPAGESGQLVPKERPTTGEWVGPARAIHYDPVSELSIG